MIFIILSDQALGRENQESSNAYSYSTFCSLINKLWYKYIVDLNSQTIEIADNKNSAK